MKVVAFAPGRVNLLGEFTDYNGGLALPFAITDGLSVRGRSAPEPYVTARALDLGEDDRFELPHPAPATGWRSYVRGIAAELVAGGLIDPIGAELEITGDLPRGAGLSSSAALEISVSLALLALAQRPVPGPFELARLAARVEGQWAGAQTGTLDQLACLASCEGHAVLIDFAAATLEPVPLRLGEWRLVLLDSGERHAHAESGYNERRLECEAAAALLGVATLREASLAAASSLAEPLASRTRYVIEENARVRAAVAALHDGELERLGELLDSSHEGIRDLFEVSTVAVEATRGRLRAAGAAGSRLVGGGFGGQLLGLFAPDVEPPAGTIEVRPGPGASARSSG
jgi:galactokinase